MTEQEKKLILENPTGDCFLQAFNLIHKLKDTRIATHKGLIEPKMVHGIAHGKGRIEGIILTHGWVELGEYVFDFSNGRELLIDKEKYYAIGQIDESQCKKYSYDEAVEKGEEDGFFRPWGFPTDEELNSV